MATSGGVPAPVAGLVAGLATYVATRIVRHVMSNEYGYGNLFEYTADLFGTIDPSMIAQGAITMALLAGAVLVATMVIKPLPAGSLIGVLAAAGIGAVAIVVLWVLPDKLTMLYDYNENWLSVVGWAVRGASIGASAAMPAVVGRRSPGLAAIPVAAGAGGHVLIVGYLLGADGIYGTYSSLIVDIVSIIPPAIAGVVVATRTAAPSSGPVSFQPNAGYGPAPGQPPTPPGGTPYAPTVATTNGLATASMICGLLCINVPAIVMGHVALSQIRRSGGTQTGRGMAITGLVFGYLGIIVSVVAVIALNVAASGLE